MPETILRRKQPHTVYTIAEAVEAGIPFRPWREARAGEWASSDDGYVGECFSVREYTDKRKHTRTLVACSFGQAWVCKGSLIEFEKRRANGSLHSVSSGTWLDREVRRYRTQSAIMVYVQMVLTGRIDWDVVGKTYRPDQAIPAATVKRLFKQGKVRTMIENELKRVLRNKGIDEAYLIDRVIEVVDLARETKDPAAMANAAKMIGNLINVPVDKPKTIVMPPFPELPGQMESSVEERLLAEERRIAQLPEHTATPVGDEDVQP